MTDGPDACPSRPDEAVSVCVRRTVTVPFVQQSRVATNQRVCHWQQAAGGPPRSFHWSAVGRGDSIRGPKCLCGLDSFPPSRVVTSGVVPFS